MAKPYSALRAVFLMKDIDQKYLTEIMGKSQSYITKRITEKAPWSQDDMYFILDLCGISRDRIHEFFPPRSIARQLKGGF